MKKAGMWAGLLVAAGLLLGSNPATAAPKNGFAVFGGMASHSADGKGTLPPITGVPFSYSSSGVSIGIDYQVALGDSLTLNPFLMSSSESTSGDLNSGVTAGHGILGLGVRYWPGDFFLGAQIGNYSEVLSGDTGGSLSASGGGFGLSAGWESPTGGLFVVGQYDSFSLSYSDADIDETGFRLQIGYRWK
jgi:hypothetical protein